MRRKFYTIEAIQKGASYAVLDPAGNEKARCTGKMKEEISQISSLNMSINQENPAFDILTPLVTKVCVRDVDKEAGTKDIVFMGRVLTVKDGMNEEGEFYRDLVCEGGLGYLNDSVWPDDFTEAQLSSLAVLAGQLIYNHYAQCGEENIFRIGTVTATGSLEGLEGRRKTWEILQEAVQRCNGEITATYEEDNEAGAGWRIDIKPANILPNPQATEIRVGDNLLSMEKAFDFTAACTRLYVWGKEREDGTRVNLSSLLDGRLYITREDIEEESRWEESALESSGLIVADYLIDDDIETPEELLAEAKAELRARRYAETDVQVSAVNLSYIQTGEGSYELGEVYPMVIEPLGITENIRVVGREVDVNEPYKPSLSMGSAGASMQRSVASGGGNRKGGEQGIIAVDGVLSETSLNPVQNKVIYAELSGKVDKSGDTMTGSLIVRGSGKALAHENPTYSSKTYMQAAHTTDGEEMGQLGFQVAGSDVNYMRLYPDRTVFKQPVNGIFRAKYIGSYASETELFTALDTELAGMATYTTKLVTVTLAWYSFYYRVSAEIYKERANFASVRFMWPLYKGSVAYASRQASVWNPLMWMNPPMYAGVEYCTTERDKGQIVYAQLVNCGKAVATQEKYIDISSLGITNIIRCCGQIDTGSGYTALPTGASYIQAYYPTRLVVYAGLQHEEAQVYARLWYTKD